ncbi:hypothetical protein BGZ76_002286 [Entomortierella beljakovae]|nr:hypothetical protein BGZ76_002286 [Entomortierella beljakovae]
MKPGGIRRLKLYRFVHERFSPPPPDTAAASDRKEEQWKETASGMMEDEEEGEEEEEDDENYEDHYDDDEEMESDKDEDHTDDDDNDETRQRRRTGYKKIRFIIEGPEDWPSSSSEEEEVVIKRSQWTGEYMKDKPETDTTLTDRLLLKYSRSIDRLRKIPGMNTHAQRTTKDPLFKQRLNRDDHYAAMAKELRQRRREKGLDVGEESSESEENIDEDDNLSNSSDGSQIDTPSQDSSVSDDSDESSEDSGTEVTGIKDELLLELFSKRIKTGLPRGNGDDYMRQVVQEAQDKSFKGAKEQPYLLVLPQKRNAYRSVDYLHRFDWMHPSAPIRVWNMYVQNKIEYNQKIIDNTPFINYTPSTSCLRCVGREVGLVNGGEYDDELSDSPDFEYDLTCINCFNARRNIQDYNEFHRDATKEAKQVIGVMKKTHYKEEVPPVFQIRCHWCGDYLPKKYDCKDLSKASRIDYKGIEPLPSFYEFDHDQRRLCLHCASECSALLKEKRRFQMYYELSSAIYPRGCNNCGVRESIEFRPSVDRTGETCFVCSEFYTHNGLNRDVPPFTEEQARLFTTTAIDNLYQDAIHWDRIANNPFLNPQFEITPYGFLNQWQSSIRREDDPITSTYILLQHNHLVRRSQDWELYTCTAKNPTQAALYFARFVALYKKRPMTYLYIRKLEDWNIPEPRGDEWEDRSSGLQTFEQLKERIRRSLVQSHSNNSKQDSSEESSSASDEDTEDNFQRIEGTFASEAEKGGFDGRKYASKATKESAERSLRSFRKGYDGSKEEMSKKLDKNRLGWRLWLAQELGNENMAMLNQLHYDNSEKERYHRNYRMTLKMIWAGIIDTEEYQKESISLRKTYSRMYRKHRPISKEHNRKLAIVRASRMASMVPRIMDKLTGNIQGLVGYVPTTPPEYEARRLPKWAKKSARNVVRKTVKDNKLLYIFHRHLQYLKHQKEKAKEIAKTIDKAPFNDRTLFYNKLEDQVKKKAQVIQEVAQKHGHLPRTTQDCLETAREIVYNEVRGPQPYSKSCEYLESGKILLSRNGLRNTLPDIFTVMRPNLLRVISGPRPPLDYKRDPIRRVFLEEISTIDKENIKRSKPAIAVSRDVYYEDHQDSFQGRLTCPKRSDLPPAINNITNPSGRYPVHLLPPEYQVHVFQAILEPEIRTANIRLIRTERYKRQSDTIQGGAPTVLPKVINKDNMRGFHREASRIKRYKPNYGHTREMVMMRGTLNVENSLRPSVNNGLENWKVANPKEVLRLKGDKKRMREEEDNKDTKVYEGTIQEIIEEQDRLHNPTTSRSKMKYFNDRRYKVDYDTNLDETPVINSVDSVKMALRESRQQPNISKITDVSAKVIGREHACTTRRMYPDQLSSHKRIHPSRPKKAHIRAVETAKEGKTNAWGRAVEIRGGKRGTGDGGYMEKNDYDMLDDERAKFGEVRRKFHELWDYERTKIINFRGWVDNPGNQKWSHARREFETYTAYEERESSPEIPNGLYDRWGVGMEYVKQNWEENMEKAIEKKAWEKMMKTNKHAEKLDRHYARIRERKLAKAEANRQLAETKPALEDEAGTEEDSDV